MKSFQLNVYKYKPITLALVFFVIASIAILIFQNILLDRYVARQEEYIKEYIRNKKSVINSVAASTSVFTQAIASYIEQTPNATREQFENYVSSLLKQDSLIYSIACTKEDFIINRVYPYEDQSFLLGTKLFEDSENEHIIKKTLRSKISTMNGPFKLKDGKLGLVTTVPIYKTNNNNSSTKNEVVGIAGIIMSYDKLKNLITHSDNKNIVDYIIYYYDSHTRTRTVMGEELVFRKNPIEEFVALRGGRTWIVSAVPKSGWASNFSNIKLIPYYVSLVLITLLVYFFIRNKRVSMSELMALNRVISESAGDTLWVLNTKTMTYRVLESNKANTISIFDEEFSEREINVEDKLLPESYNLLKEKIYSERKKCEMGANKSLNFRLEIQFYNKFGEIVWGDISATFLPPAGFIKKSNTCKVLGVTRVITDKKLNELELIKKEERLRIITDNIDICVHTIEPETFKFTYSSSASFNILGYTPEEMLGQNIFSLLPPEDLLSVKKAVFQEIEKFKTGEIDKIRMKKERQLRHKTSKYVWVELTLNSVLDEEGKLEHFIGTATCINERKKMTMKLEEQRKQLQLANSTKDKFFSIIAHDLKNPFAAVLNISELLVNYRHKMSPEKLNELIESINYSMKFIYQLLENLLQWSRASSGSIEFEPQVFELTDFVKKSIELIKHQASVKNIFINLEGDTTSEKYAFFDYNMIATVLRNFISNSIKFSYEYSTITIRIENYIENQYKISVIDEGVGIPEGKLEKLFFIGEKITTKGTKKETGTGLGLILCKEFIDKHKSKIGVISRDGNGSTFYFTVKKAMPRITNSKDTNLIN